MNKDVTAGWFAQFLRSLPVTLIWIADAERQMKLAVRVAAINIVETFRSPPVTLYRFVAFRSEPKADPIGLEHLFAMHEMHVPGALENDDFCDSGAAVPLKLRGTTSQSGDRQGQNGAS